MAFLFTCTRIIHRRSHFASHSSQPTQSLKGKKILIRVPRSSWMGCVWHSQDATNPEASSCRLGVLNISTVSLLPTSSKFTELKCQHYNVFAFFGGSFSLPSVPTTEWNKHSISQLPSHFNRMDCFIFILWSKMLAEMCGYKGGWILSPLYYPSPLLSFSSTKRNCKWEKAFRYEYPGKQKNRKRNKVFSLCKALQSSSYACCSPSVRALISPALLASSLLHS